VGCAGACVCVCFWGGAETQTRAVRGAASAAFAAPSAAADDVKDDEDDGWCVCVPVTRW